jgi:hypothetical protein
MKLLLGATNRHTATRGFVSQVSRKVLMDGSITFPIALFKKGVNNNHQGFDKR